VKKENKKTNKKERTPLLKTKVKLDNSVEVELKDPSKSLLGKIFVYLIVIGMTVLSLVSLILLIVEVSSK